MRVGRREQHHVAGPEGLVVDPWEAVVPHGPVVDDAQADPAERRHRATLRKDAAGFGARIKAAAEAAIPPR
ncbi:hypothetical protein GCM10010254_66770 [Streptomyces chromofuscus]|nr:hypothetical protein GCM10010254_66770 [Streptomyces chromofuscus]